MDDLKGSEKTYERPKDQPKRKLKPVVDENQVVKKKEPKMILGFIDPRDLEDLGKYIFFDVLVPELQYGVVDIVKLLLRMDDFGRRDRGRNDRRGYTSYASKYRPSRDSRRDRDGYDRRDRRDERETNGYDDIVIKDRRSAERIVDELQDRIEDCGEATVGDLYQLVRYPSKYTDENWGWRRSKDIGLKKVPGGWLIDVAEPISLI